MPNGQGLIAGGDNVDLMAPFLTNGFFSIRIFNPFGPSYSLGPNMPTGRWYPTLATLPDGTILIVGGAQVRLLLSVIRGQLAPTLVLLHIKNCNYRCSYMALLRLSWSCSFRCVIMNLQRVHHHLDFLSFSPSALAGKTPPSNVARLPKCNPPSQFGLTIWARISAGCLL